ncbi:RNA-binding protein [Thermococci archaeon]|uniref:CooT family nickel-binding protein n=1 Tax=Palaeococcus sp. (in: euryarchaeotes) TaxID=2820298 RepID=UPI000F187A6B|nr:CooT family nickel-binding protein [Palaeococcus sp. (in: euryarchaeotes)]MCD6560016.1 CooT family nickel-binding protein [Palaeococcus sp. (in: euryarchaeotes)]RLF77442.1 MAG: RNA-binding protein [Thermococci archaeon]RLF90287.1 MAG: RNA-binding protein [Thermococci archaeon]
MCQSKVVIIENGKLRVVMTDVTLLDIHDGKIILRNLLGRELVLEKYQLESVDFISHKAYLRPVK